MSKKDLSYYVNKNVVIIKCKKRAKELFKLSKPGQQKSLTQCKSIAAIELGFKDWFDLQNSIKKKCALELNICEQELITDFHNLLKDCMLGKSTGIHIEVRQTHGRIKVRRNGELGDYTKGKDFSYEYISDFTNAFLKKLFPNKIFSLTDCSSASTVYMVNNEQAIIQVQSIPAHQAGFDLVLRFSYSALYKNFSSLTSLGYSDSHVKQILEATSKDSGCFLLAGVTGQGATTTLKVLANQLHNNSNKKINLIETAPEYPLLNKGITQIQCNIPKDYNEYASMYEVPVNSSLKNGAEIILIDETRERTTAKIIEKHHKSALFMTAVHAVGAIGIIRRLHDFDINAQTISNPNFCHGLVYQKLMPVLCPHCSQDVSTINNNKNAKHYAEYLEAFKKKYPSNKLDDVRIRNYDGCSQCNHGINSRTVCAEIIVLDKKMRQLIKDNDLEGLRSHWMGLSDNNLLSNDMTGKTAHEHALSKMLLGQIDPLDVLYNFCPLD